MENVTFIPSWAVPVLTAGHRAVLPLPVLSIITGTWSWGAALAPSSPALVGKGGKNPLNSSLLTAKVNYLMGFWTEGAQKG